MDDCTLLFGTCFCAASSETREEKEMLDLGNLRVQCLLDGDPIRSGPKSYHD